MDYALVADIEAEYKSIDFAATGSKVTTTEIEEFITQASALIDGYVSNKYTIPVTGAASLAVLKMICTWLVKSRVNSILSVKAPQDKTKQDPDGPSLFQQAMKLLEQIKKGQLVLPDAVASNSTGGMDSYTADLELKYAFHQNREDW